jgi:anti-sigma factor RsiW
MTTQLECERTLLVQADFDGELDAAQAAALQGHLAECTLCQGVQVQLTRSRALLRAAPRYAASLELREAIRSQTGEIAPGAASRRREGSAGRAANGERTGSFWRRNGGRHNERSPTPRWRFGLGWGSAVAAALFASIVLLVPRSPDVGAQLVSNRLRAMQVESHLIDVASTDHHTVKPWFAGKVDFAPPVKQLDAEGYVLKGGRVDVVAGGPAAVLVYQAGRHLIDVYIWPASRGQGGFVQSRQLDGFNLRQWQEGDLAVWCVSDISAAELSRFAQRWQTAVGN